MYFRTWAKLWKSSKGHCWARVVLECTYSAKHYAIYVHERRGKFLDKIWRRQDTWIEGITLLGPVSGGLIVCIFDNFAVYGDLRRRLQNALALKSPSSNTSPLSIIHQLQLAA